MRQARIIRLSEGECRTIRFFSERIALADGRSQTTVNITRTGHFYDRRYGDFDITPAMLAEMVKNFDANTYGQEIYLDVAHDPSNGSAATVKRLFVQGDKLRADVAWTDYGANAVKKKGFRYLSAEFNENYTTTEHPRREVGAVLMGAALTTRPVIKHLDPIDPDSVVLSDAAFAGSRSRIYTDPGLIRQLSEEVSAMKDFLKKLRAALEAKKLAEPVIKVLSDLFTAAAEKLLDDKPAMEALLEGFVLHGEALGKQMAGATGEVKLDLSGFAELLATVKKPGTTTTDPNAPKALTEEDVTRIFTKIQTDAAKRLSDEKAALATNQATFDRVLAEFKDLDKTDLKDMVDDIRPTITAALSEEQVTAVAKSVAKNVEKLSVARKLADRGFTVAGAVSVAVRGQERPALALQEAIDSKLKLTSAYQGRKLPEVGKENPKVQRVLSLLDQVLGLERMEKEVKYLAGGLESISDVNLPASFVRTVIRQALSDLNLLNLVNVLGDAITSSMTMNIPYEVRDTSAIVNQGIVYEGQGINGLSVTQSMDIAYLHAIKIALKLSNEVIFFTRSNKLIDWDAFARSVDTAARVVRELICVRIANTIQRLSDAYGAITVAAEDFHLQLDGATVSIIKTVNFPIVRMNQIYDMKGNAVGNPTNPITVKLNNVVINPYDGTNTQGAGTYYQVTNYNLGYVQFVNQLGAPVFPAQTANCNITYDKATNIVKFNTDLGADELDIHWNGALQAFGSAKAQLKQTRFVKADYAIMSSVLNDSITNAKNFTAAGMRKDSGITDDGDLAMVKGIPCFDTDAPGIDMGEERVIIGVRGSCTYGVGKPWVMGVPFEAVNNTGQPTGQKVSYGEEYSTVHVPLPLQKFHISVICYSVTGR